MRRLAISVLALFVSLPAMTQPALAVKPLSKLDDRLLAVVPRLTLRETSLRDAIGQLAAVAKVEILSDGKAMEDAGIDLDVPVTLNIEPSTLVNALDALLTPFDLVAIVRDDLLEVTTKERAAQRPFVHVHDVSDLAVDGAGLETLTAVLQHLSPCSWEEVGGDGTIRPDVTAARRACVVSQAWPQQWQIARFLATLRRLKATPAEQRRPVAAEGYWSDAGPAESGRTGLDTRVDVAFEEVPLREVLVRISKQTKVPIGIDARALEECGVDLDAPVTLSLAGRPLAVVLDRILDPLDLAIDLTGDRLLVTSKEVAAESVSAAIYPLPLDGRNVAALVDTIQRTIGGPDAWADQGGYGFITAIEGGMRCLVIGQTTANHRAIAAFLRSLE